MKSRPLFHLLSADNCFREVVQQFVNQASRTSKRTACHLHSFARPFSSFSLFLSRESTKQDARLARLNWAFTHAFSVQMHRYYGV